jgi:hypothetical protein
VKLQDGIVFAIWYKQLLGTVHSIRSQSLAETCFVAPLSQSFKFRYLLQVKEIPGQPAPLNKHYPKESTFHVD